jgi:hypothetical protein
LAAQFSGSNPGAGDVEHDQTSVAGRHRGAGRVGGCHNPRLESLGTKLREQGMEDALVIGHEHDRIGGQLRPGGHPGDHKDGR